MASVRITVNSIYKGSYYKNDVCLSEVMLVQYASAANAMPAQEQQAAVVYDSRPEVTGCELLDRLSTRSGPGTQYQEPGTFFRNDTWKGKTVRVLKKATGNGVWWVQVDFQTDNGNSYRVWTGKKRVDVNLDRVQAVQELAGLGILAVVDGEEVLLGNQKLLQEKDVSFTPCNQAGTVVYIAEAGKYVGAVVISDTVKDGAVQALQSVKAAGIRKTVMLSGDRKQAAAAVGKALGLDEIRAELLPQDKVANVETLISELPKGSTLGFVGDGLNDAPVLSRADVGIAMGSMGSDAAIEAADVVIMDDDLRKLPVGIRIARKTLRICRQNIVFALGVKLVILILGALGFANMWLAVFGDVGVSVIAILNSMRTLKS